MIVDTLLAKVFGTKTEREIKGMLPKVASISEFEPAIRQLLSDIDLAAKTIEFKEKSRKGAARRPS
jgi:preprotein translocase subunit SecA